MKSTLRAKLLQHFLKKNQEGGFTLIELLVVIIIIGILAAIALPSFLNQANKARQSEATTNIGAINRGQQAYNLETSEFSRSVAGLGLGIRVTTDNYEFGDDGAFGTNTPGQMDGIDAAGGIDYDATDDTQYALGGVVYAAPASAAKENALKGYTGATYLLSAQSTGETTSTTLLCENNEAGPAAGIGTIAVDGTTGLITNIPCGTGSTAK